LGTISSSKAWSWSALTYFGINFVDNFVVLLLLWMMMICLEGMFFMSSGSLPAG